MGSQGHNGGGTGGIVVGTGIIHFPAEVAKMVIVCCEHKTTIVLLAFHLGDDIEKLVILKELIVDFGTNGLHALNGFRCHPDDGLFHHSMSIGLEELDRCWPSINQSCIRTFRCLQAGKILAMTIGEPELTNDQTVSIFRLAQVFIHLFRIEIQGIHMIHRECAVYAGRVFPHGIIDARGQFFAIGPKFHLPTERVDVDGKRLAYQLIDTNFLKFLLQIFSGLIGTVFGITAALVLGGAQLLDDLLIIR